MHSDSRAPITEQVLIGPHCLPAEWTLPDRALGSVVFSNSSGSRRQSAQNHHVARIFQSYGLATLLFDLLTPEEVLQREHLLNIGLLAERVQGALQWVQVRTKPKFLPMGIFATGTGTAAALIAASCMPRQVHAIVSRSGRPDMADGYMTTVHAPTLLIVGAKDPYVLNINRACMQSMPCVTELKIIPRATHDFEELGTLDAAASLAGDWFLTNFSPSDEAPIEEILLRR